MNVKHRINMFIASEWVSKSLKSHWKDELKSGSGWVSEKELDESANEWVSENLWMGGFVNEEDGESMNEEMSNWIWDTESLNIYSCKLGCQCSLVALKLTFYVPFITVWVPYVLPASRPYLGIDAPLELQHVGILLRIDEFIREIHSQTFYFNPEKNTGGALMICNAPHEKTYRGSINHV